MAEAENQSAEAENSITAQLTSPVLNETEVSNKLKLQAISAVDEFKMTSLSSKHTIKPFNGEGDVYAWLTKIELVAMLTGVKDVHCLIPLYLEDGALAVYLEMTKEEKGDLTLLKAGLTRAFSDSQFVSYCKLRAVRWAGESVDVYVNSVRKLVKECGLKGDGLEQLVKLAFVTGLPDGVAVELQQVVDVENIAVSDLLARDLVRRRPVRH